MWISSISLDKLVFWENFWEEETYDDEMVTLKFNYETKCLLHFKTPSTSQKVSPRKFPNTLKVSDWSATIWKTNKRYLYKKGRLYFATRKMIKHPRKQTRWENNNCVARPHTNVPRPFECLRLSCNNLSR